MKGAYKKPSYNFVLLAATSGTNCYFTNNHDWEVCGVPVGDEIVFMEEPCTEEPGSDFDINQFSGGHNTSVFGS